MTYEEKNALLVENGKATRFNGENAAYYAARGRIAHKRKVAMREMLNAILDAQVPKALADELPDIDKKHTNLQALLTREVLEGIRNGNHHQVNSILNQAGMMEIEDTEEDEQSNLDAWIGAIDKVVEEEDE